MIQSRNFPVRLQIRKRKNERERKKINVSMLNISGIRAFVGTQLCRYDTVRHKLDLESFVYSKSVSTTDMFCNCNTPKITHSILYAFYSISLHHMRFNRIHFHNINRKNYVESQTKTKILLFSWKKNAFYFYAIHEGFEINA